MSAVELAAQLANDPAFQRAAIARDAERSLVASRLRDAEQPIVADLAAVGVEVTSVWDLVNTAEPYPEALAVLLEHLERGGYPDRVLEGLARALAVPPAHPYWSRLRELYLRADGRDEREGLAVALAASATAAELDALVALVSTGAGGSARIHFLRSILRVGSERGREVLEALRADPELGAEATALLGRRSRG